MEKTHLCSVCGERVSESEKYCSKCGAVNYHNIKVVERVVSENKNFFGEVKKAKFVFKVTKTIGIILIALSVLVDIIFAFSALSGDAFDFIGILPISGIAFTAGLIILFVFK